MALWQETMTAIIWPDTDGYVVMGDGDVIIAGPCVSIEDALNEAESFGLTISNMDDVEKWQQPDEDWGINEDD
jgi:hypothetical protein